MNEVAFTLFCGCTICLTLQVGIAIYTFKVLERIKDFMDFAWDFMERSSSTVSTSADAKKQSRNLTRTIFRKVQTDQETTKRDLWEQISF